MTAKLSLRSPTDMIAAVPYLIGFHPTDSAVVLGMKGKKLSFAARHDLDVPAAAFDHLAEVVAGQGLDCAAVLGYGPAHRVDGVVKEVRDALESRGLEVVEALRIAEGRFWSYVCANLECCPPEGVSYDAESTQVAAHATLAGMVALPDRGAVVRQIEPVGFLAREAMRQATERAYGRLGHLLDAAPASDLLGRRAIRKAGAAAVTEAMRRYREGGQLTDDEVAWLTALLVHLPVRDFAWERIGDEGWHVQLWTDVVRRAEEEVLPAPASLLAFAAWRAGQGTLAGAAVERALAANSAYTLALLMQEVLTRGIAPSALADFPASTDARAGGPAVRARRRPKRRRFRNSSS
ncbi:DUF4192 domain-containing protein [Actinomycetes bacterium KLBMP 9797]